MALPPSEQGFLEKLAGRIGTLEREVSRLGALPDDGGLLPRFAPENIPWIVSLWPLQGNADDLAGINGLDLTVTGPTTAQQREFAYYQFDGTDDVLHVADTGVLDITGALSDHGWVYFDNAAGATEFILAKWRTDNDNRSYTNWRSPGGNINFSVTSDGTGGTFVNLTSTSTPGAGIWIFWCATFDPSTAMDLWLGIDGAPLEQDTLTVGVPAAIHSGSARLQLGASQDGFASVDSEMTGRQTRVGLHEGLIADDTIRQLYNQGLEYLGIGG